MCSDYYSVKGTGKAELVVKKSRFIAQVDYVDTATAAENFIHSIKEVHKEASHNVFAYIVGRQGIIQKSSDDGEPNGTAGRPILEVIKNKNLQNVVVVVTRYFGGKLLGIGGLARSYSQAAVEGIEAAKIVRKVLHRRLRVTVEYSLLGILQRRIEETDIILKKIDYAELVTLEVLVKECDKRKYRELFINLTSAQAVVSEQEKIYLDFMNAKI